MDNQPNLTGSHRTSTDTGATPINKAPQNPYVEHRMEFVARINGVDYLNDSIATNIEEVWKSLAAAPGRIIWIAGASEDQTDYSMLHEVVKDKVKAIVSIGKQRNFRLWQAFSRHVRHVVDADNVEEAVHFGFSLAEANETVLFSPGCGSYGSYENFRERGRDFKKCVTDIYKALLRK